MNQKKEKTGNQLLLTQQDVILIKNSYEPTKVDIYGNLYDCLTNYNKLSRRDLDKDITFDSKARVVLLNYENRKVLMEKIKTEWFSIAEPTVSDVKVKCQLCHTPNTYIFYIQNRLTKSELHIGSECIKKYHDIKGVQQGFKKMSDMQKNVQQQKRRIQFETYEEEDNELDFSDNSKKIFDNFPIMLPYELHKDLERVIHQSSVIKFSYIKSGGDIEEAVRKYRNLKVEYHTLIEKANEHIKTYKNNRLICDKSTAQWLKENDPDIWERVSKNKGLFKESTLTGVYFTDFIKKNMPIFASCLHDQDIKILKVQNKFILFSFNDGRSSNAITFLVPIKFFMNCIGSKCISEPSFQYTRRDLKEISIENTRSNFEAVYNHYRDILRKNGYDFEIEDKTEQAYWVYLSHLVKAERWGSTRHADAMYKKSTYEIFLNVFSPYILEENSSVQAEFSLIKTKMEAGQRWISQDEKDKNEEIAREAHGLQKQREYIQYQ